MNALLKVAGLRVSLPVADGTLHAVRGVDLSVSRGETVCLVGESGCGKSLTSLALMGLMAKFKPHRILFLLDSLWFAALAGGQVWRILKGDSLWWILLVLFEIWLVMSGIELYKHFARTKKV